MTPAGSKATSSASVFRWHRPLQYSFSVLLVFAIWQLMVSTSAVSTLLLPQPKDVISKLLEHRGPLIRESAFTVWAAGLGLILGSGFAVITAGIVTLSRPLRATVVPLLVISQTFPVQAVAPLLVLWFGVGILPKVSTSVLICFFPMAIVTLHGLLNVDRDLLDYAHTLGASRLQVFMKFRLPNAVPAMIGGLKVAATLSVIGAVIGEFVSPQHGLGRVILMAQRQFETATMFAALVLLACIGFAFYLAAVGLELWLRRVRRLSRED